MSGNSLLKCSIWMSTKVVYLQHYLVVTRLVSATWNCCHIDTHSVDTIQPCTSLVSLHVKPHVGRLHVYLPVIHHLKFWAEWPESFTCFFGNMEVQWILKQVSTESWPRWRKFSCCSCQDLNPRPFDHKSISLPLSYPWSTLKIRWNGQWYQHVLATYVF